MAYARRDIRGGAVETTLSGAISGTPASFAISASTGWPDGATGNFVVAIDRPVDGQTNANFEKILCSTRVGLTVNIVTRGYDGTTSHDHAPGARVEHSFGAVDFDEANYWVAELAGATDTAGDLHVADGADSITKLAKGANSRVLSVDSGGTLGYSQVTSAMIGTDVIAAGNIAPDAVGASEIAAGAVGTSELADLGVATGDIADLAVTGGKIANDTITATQIAGGAIGASELADNAVDTAAIVNANVTQAKLASDVVVVNARAANHTFTADNTFTNQTSYADFPGAAALAALQVSFTKRSSSTRLILEIFGTCVLDSGVQQNLFLGIAVGATTFDIATSNFQSAPLRFSIHGVTEGTGITSGVHTVKARFKAAGASSVKFYNGEDQVSFSITEVT